MPDNLPAKLPDGDTDLLPMASATPEDSYLAECWQQARDRWGRHQKVELSAGFVTAIAGGLGSILYTGFAWSAVGGALMGVCVGFLVGLLFIFFYYLTTSPKELNKKRKNELAIALSDLAKTKADAAQQLEAVRAKNEQEIEKLRTELNELTAHKLVFEIDKRNTVIKVEQTNSALRIFADIQLRFENNDTQQRSIKRFDVSLHQGGIVDGRNAAEVFTLFFISDISRDGMPINRDKFEGLTLAAGELSPFYMIRTILTVEDGSHIKSAEDLDPGHYLHIAIESSGYQPEFTANLHPHWSAACSDKGTTQIVVRGARSIQKDFRRLG